MSVCPYTEFLSLRFACSELVVMLKRFHHLRLACAFLLKGYHH